ncbi:MAG: GNAT family N-acetyltransferase [Bacteroidota bacterium]|nr:GNAT family N-acetyltransferase [Bacteroidota bacterium]
MKIQTLLVSDLGSIAELQPEGWPDIMPAVSFYINSDFCISIKVIVENKIAGIGAGIIHKDIAWLAHIIVHPEYRNKGIGRMITQTLVDRLYAKNCSTIYLIATDLGAPVYEKVGFETETEYIFFKDIQMAQKFELSSNITAYTDAYKKQIGHIDRQVSGEERMFHIEPYLTGAYLYIQGNIVEGFYLPSFGEGLIIANTSQSGIDLMKLRLTVNENVAFPVDNLNAKEFMYQNNFKEFKSAKRMRLGLRRTWLAQHIYNRIGGNLG